MFFVAVVLSRVFFLDRPASVDGKKKKKHPKTNAFNMETVGAAAAGLEDYDSSEIFASDWFGEASPDNELHTVDKGRWAFLPVMEASAVRMWLFSTYEEKKIVLHRTILWYSFFFGFVLGKVP